MMEKKVSWNDIPSLDGVGIDWDYKPHAALDKRKYVRLDMGAVFQLVELRKIVVKVNSTKQICDGSLVDISQGGLALTSPVQLEVDHPVKVGLFLGAAKIVSRGLVRHHTKTGNGHYVTGVQFVGLPQESADYIAGLYAAKVLYHAAT